MSPGILRQICRLIIPVFLITSGQAMHTCLTSFYAALHTIFRGIWTLNDLKWFKMVQNGPELAKNGKLFVQNGHKCSKIVLNGENSVN